MAAWDITWKDLRLLARDKRALVLLLMLPLMFITILGMSAGKFLTGGGDERKMKIGVVDESRTEYSASLIDALKNHGDDFVILTFDSLAAARNALDNDEAGVLLKIAADYETRVEDIRMRDILNSAISPKTKTPEAMGLNFESRSALSGEGIAKALVYGDALRTITPIAAEKHSALRGAAKNRDFSDEDEPSQVAEKQAAAKETLEDKIYMILVPGFTVMFVFFLINIMARSFIAERDQGTLRRLRLAPIDSVSILIGKTLPFYLTSVVQTSLLFLCGKLLFQMPWGPEPIYLIPVILCTSLAATSLGLLLATMVHTDQQVSSFGTSIVLVLGGISGCMFPRLWLPELMKKISLFTPHAWSLEAFDAVLTHKVVDQMLVFDCCLALLGFAAMFFVCGWLRFRVAN